MTNQIGDAPVQEQYRSQMESVVRSLDEIFNGDLKGDARQTGFVLLVFPFGNTDNRCNFMSNGGDRKDIICLFKEMIARFEGQPEMKGNA